MINFFLIFKQVNTHVYKFNHFARARKEHPFHIVTSTNTVARANIYTLCLSIEREKVKKEDI